MRGRSQHDADILRTAIEMSGGSHLRYDAPLPIIIDRLFHARWNRHWVPAAPDVIERDCERGDGALCATPTRLRFRALGTQTIDFP